jgi:putative ABC transport system permease protein
MLERRREIGILKAVGHSSRSVLSMVLIENAVVAAIGAVTGMVVVTIATALIGAGVLETDLTVGRGVAVSVVAGVVAVVVLVAGLVAWGPTRVRPLEVLRYE